MSETKDALQPVLAIVGNSVSSEDPTSDEEQEIMYMRVDCRRPQWIQNQITVTEVCEAILVDLNDDPTISVKAMWGAKNVGLFKIESHNFEYYIGKSLIIRGHEIPLEAVRKQPRFSFIEDHQGGAAQKPGRRDGLLVTIYDAWELRHRNLSNELFDNFFVENGYEITKQTRPQFVRGTRIPNMNRFLVLEKEKQDGSKIDLDVVGTEIQVQGLRFKKAYQGMKSFATYAIQNTDGIALRKRDLKL